MVVPQKISDGMDTFAVLAIPFFIIAGMFFGGILSGILTPHTRRWAHRGARHSRG